jgi:hypothetical protein
MDDEPVDFDFEKGSTKPRMWRDFKRAFANTFHVGELAAVIESMCRCPTGGYAGTNPRVMVAIALHAFAAADVAGRDAAARAYWEWVELHKPPRGPIPVCPSNDPTYGRPLDVARARVRVGTRIVDLRDGRIRNSAIVTEVRAECVFAQFDPAAVFLGPPTFAARYDEFAIEPEWPEGRGTDGDA